MLALHAHLQIAVDLEAAILKTTAKANERQTGSALFSGLDCVKRLQDQLHNAVALERGQCNQLGSCRKNNPERRMIEEVHVSR